MNKVKIHLWLLWMAFLGGLLVTGIGLWQLIDASAIFASGDVYEAKVVGTIPLGEDGTPYPILQWTGKDGSLHRMSSPGQAEFLGIGDTVEIVTQPLNPAATRVRSLRAVSPKHVLPVLSGIALCLLAGLRLRR
jgi:hypothetical protein